MKLDFNHEQLSLICFALGVNLAFFSSCEEGNDPRTHSQFLKSRAKTTAKILQEINRAVNQEKKGGTP